MIFPKKWKRNSTNSTSSTSSSSSKQQQIQQSQSSTSISIFVFEAELMCMPRDILNVIFSFFSPADLCSIARTCKRFRTFSSKDIFWRHHCAVSWKTDKLFPSHKSLWMKWIRNRTAQMQLDKNTTWLVTDRTNSSSPMNAPTTLRVATVVGPHYDFLFKFVLVGTRGVGKTTLLVRYSDEHFEGETRGHHTLTKDLRVRDVDYSGWHIKLQIWDAQCRTQHYLPLLKNAKGLLLCFSVSDRESLFSDKHGAAFWYDAIRKLTPDTPIILCGCKSDLVDEREVKREEAMEWAKSKSLSYFETSSRTNDGVYEVFSELLCQAAQGMMPAFVPNRAQLELMGIDMSQYSYSRGTCNVM